MVKWLRRLSLRKQQQYQSARAQRICLTKEIRLICRRSRSRTRQSKCQAMEMEMIILGQVSVSQRRCWMTRFTTAGMSKQWIENQDTNGYGCLASAGCHWGYSLKIPPFDISSIWEAIDQFLLEHWLQPIRHAPITGPVLVSRSWCLLQFWTKHRVQLASCGQITTAKPRSSRPTCPRINELYIIHVPTDSRKPLLAHPPPAWSYSSQTPDSSLRSLSLPTPAPWFAPTTSCARAWRK